MPKDVALYATCWTLAGDSIPGLTDEISPHSFAARVEAAREAGFAGLGLALADYRVLKETLGVPEMRMILALNHMTCVEFEVLTDWFTTGERRARSDAARAEFLRAAEEFAAWQIKVVGDFIDTDDDAWPLDRLAQEFGALCEDAAKVGTRITLELLPFSNIKSPKHGLSIVEAAGARNGGLLLDVWHMERGHIPYSEVAALPASAIGWIELDDAAAEQVGTMYEDTVHNRRLCGEGDFDIAGFLRAVRTTGYSGGYGVEIIAKEHRSRPLKEAARRAFDTTIRQFETLG
jgi:sugar phosphate isomerase/epimerase